MNTLRGEMRGGNKRCYMNGIEIVQIGMLNIRLYLNIKMGRYFKTETIVPCPQKTSSKNLKKKMYNNTKQ